MDANILGTDFTWDQYGLQVHKLGLNGDDTGRQWITQNGEFVADVSEYYALLPNEEVVKTAEQVAEEIGAKPFTGHAGTARHLDAWAQPFEGKDHILKCGHRVHGFYAWKDPVDVGGGDMVQLGFIVSNSIDASLAFRTALFTFRPACSNTVFLNFKGIAAQDVLAKYYKVHMKSKNDTALLTPGELKDTLTNLVDSGFGVLDTYKGWNVENIKKQKALALQNALPKSILPEWLRVEPVDLKVPRATPIWEVYNDITEAIWHRPTIDMTKEQHFKALHRVLVPAPGVR